MLDCNLNDPRPKVDRFNWYLNLISDCEFHLANYFQINSTWPFRTFKQIENRGPSQGTGVGGHGDDERSESILFFGFLFQLT